MKNIPLSDDLYAQIQAHIQGSDEFDSPEEYVDFVLQSVLNGDEDMDLDDDDEDDEDEDDEDGEKKSKVRDRLENLGYLD
ncbi:MAG: hypothetical protein KIH62_000840 [Candidatus Kerfeldbacteria bacterium]|nr:hypothetical protein [Candidatus Kerfeldbacteria bacterium]